MGQASSHFHLSHGRRHSTTTVDVNVRKAASRVNTVSSGGMVKPFAGSFHNLTCEYQLTPTAVASTAAAAAAIRKTSQDTTGEQGGVIGHGSSNASLITSQDLLCQSATVLPAEEIEILKSSLKQVKIAREYLGWKGMMGIFESIPGVSEQFKNSPNAPIRKGDNWELMGQGITFLSGIERFISRLDRPKSFESFAHTLSKSHKTYGVPIIYILKALEVFEKVIVNHLTAINDESLGKNEQLSQAWSNFFQILKNTMEKHMSQHTD